MTNSDATDEILKQAADRIIEDCKQMGDTFTQDQEAEFGEFVAGLVNAEPPTDEQIWQTIEVVMETIRANHREKALRSINAFILQFICGCDQTSGAFQYLPILSQAKDAIKAGLFDQAGEMLMTFLTKCREAARSMQTSPENEIK